MQLSKSGPSGPDDRAPPSPSFSDLVNCRLLVQVTGLDTGQPGTNRSPHHILCAGCTQVLTVVK